MGTLHIGMAIGINAEEDILVLLMIEKLVNTQMIPITFLLSIGTA